MVHQSCYLWLLYRARSLQYTQSVPFLSVCPTFCPISTSHNVRSFVSMVTEEGSGSWEEGMSLESSAMLFRALNSLIERLAVFIHVQC